MRLLPIRELELIWLSRVLLPCVMLFYCVSAGIAVLTWGGLVGPLQGYARMTELALVGHLAAAVLLAAQSIVGAAILRALGWRWQSSTAMERWLFAVVTGFVVFEVVLLVLALSHALRPGLVAGLGCAAVALAFASDRSMLSRPRALLLPDHARGSALVWAAGICVLIAWMAWMWPLAIQTALPNSDWDSALYHLPLAERYLAGEVWNPDPLFSAYSFPGGVSLMYAALLGFGLEHAVIPYNFLFVILSLAAAHALATRLGNASSGAWAVLVCAGIHVLWQQGLDPRVDGFLSFFVVTAMLGLVIALQQRSNPAPLYLLSLSIGAAIGTKYTGVFIGCAFVATALALLLWKRVRGDLLPATRSLALCAALVLVPNAAWYASNIVLHGDPLFPMLRGDYYELAGQPGKRLPMTGALDAQWASLRDDALERTRARELADRFEASPPSTLFDLIDVYRRPHAYATKPNHFASPLLLLFALLPFALPRDRGRRDGGVALYGLALVCFFGLASQTNLLRYTLPFLTLFGVGSAVVIARISHPLWQALWLASGVAVLVSHHAPEVRQLEQLRPALYAATNGDRLEWLKGVGYNFTRSMPIVVDRINREIEAGTMAPDSVIFMVGEGKGRLLACGYLPDLSWFMQRWSVEL
ncbi:MAG: hypothetical protein GY944_00780, partial [bacterium]|nr:hypothetical protein [bacterium]